MSTGSYDLLPDLHHCFDRKYQFGLDLFESAMVEQVRRRKYRTILPLQNAFSTKISCGADPDATYHGMSREKPRDYSILTNR